jgi:hypothetical protein
MDVRITEIAPEAADQIAARVAERLAARQVGAPAVRQSPPVAVRVSPPAGRPLVGQGTAYKPAPLPPATPLTDTEHTALKESVPAAIEWLAKHQGDDGLWHAGNFGGNANYDVGVTGLATLCFLGAGETTTTGAHAENVKRALKRFAELQDVEGCIGPRVSAHFMYNHAYATLALVEAYGATQSPVLKGPAQNGVNFILQAQNPYLGWRYGVRDGDNDTNVTGMMMTVLKAALTAGLAVDANAFQGGLSWLDKMTEPEFGRVGYQQRGGPPARTMEAIHRFPADRVETPTAVATAARAFAGLDPATNEWIRKGADLLAAKPPRWNEAEGSIDYLYWYWGSLAMARRGGDHWSSWRSHLVRALTPNQRREKGRDEEGSWDPVDPWSGEGGRVYATAMACLASQLALGAKTAK